MVSTAVLLALRRGPVYGRELIHALGELADTSRRAGGPTPADLDAMRARLLLVGDLGEAVERLRVSLARERPSA